MKVLLLNYPYLEEELKAQGAEVVSAGVESDCDIVFDPDDFDVQDALRKISFEPDWILYMDSLKRMIPRGLENIRCKVGIFCLDSTLNRFWHEPLTEICDLVLCDQKPEADYYSELGRNAHWLPLAADSRIFHPDENPKKYDISFIGSMHGSNRLKRDNLLKLLKSRFKIKVFEGNPPIDAEQAAKIYNQSRIVLNENLFPSVNLRLFEAMACNCAVLTEDTAPGLGELFTDEKHLLTFNPDNLIAKIEKYLNNDAERVRIAQAGSDCVKLGHTLENRSRKLFDLLKETDESDEDADRQRKSSIGRACYGYALKWSKRDNKSLEYPAEMLEGSLDSEKSFDTLMTLGRLRFLEGDHERAIGCFNDANLIDARSVLPKLYIGSVFTISGNDALARQFFEAAARNSGVKNDKPVAIKPGTEKFHLFWGDFLRDHDDALEPGLMKYHLPFPFWSALEHYSKAAEINPANWERVGDLLMEFQAPDQAYAAYSQAGDAIPRQKSLQAGKGAYLKRREQINYPVKNPSLSLCMITKDESGNLEELLSEIADVFDEIIIGDTGSEDNTIEVASQYGAKILQIEWNDDFSEARNQTIKEANCDYIMYLDGDDRIERTDLVNFRNNLSTSGEYIYYVKVINENNDEVCLQKRVFPNFFDLQFEGAIHEQILADSDHFKFVKSDLCIVHKGYADSMVLMKKAERNLKIIYKSLQSYPNDYHLHYHASLCFMNLGMETEALEHLRTIAFSNTARRQNPEIFEHSFILLSRIFRRMGEKPTALRMMFNLIETMPESIAGHYFLGVLYFDEQLYSECRREMEIYITHELSPRGIPLPLAKMKGWAHYYLGRCLEHQGQFDRSISEYQEALKYTPDTAKILGDIGRVLYRTHDVNGSIMYLEQCLVKHPGDRNAQKLLKRIRSDVRTQ